MVKFCGSLSLALLLMLCGCVLAPGYQPVGDYIDSAPDYDGEAPQLPNVDFIPITLQLVQDEAFDQSLQQTSDNRELLAGGERYAYRIGPGDVLSIIVWEHPELTIPAGEVRSADSAGHLVSENGTIFFPFAGELKVARKTTTEVRRQITAAIKDKIANPQVDVRIAAFRSKRVYLIGEVSKPGIQPVTDVPLSLIDAINVAGGMTKDADRREVVVKRDGRLYYFDLIALYEAGELASSYWLRDGDVVTVPDRLDQKVFVMGEVAVPKALLMHERRMTLAEAISEAGGINPISSAPERMYVIRTGDPKSQIFHINSASPDAYLLSEQFALRPRDVVYVDTAPIARWNRVVSQILPSASALNSFNAAGRGLLR